MTSPTPEEKEPGDEIVTALYRRFKDWSARGFGPDDVTWCEVKADIVALIDARRSPSRKAVLEEAARVADRWADIFPQAGNSISAAIRALAEEEK